MILKTYYLACLSHASYLVGDEKAGVAAVVDPRRDVAEYVADAREMGLAIQWVLLTHFHADFVSGHLELREATGAAIGLGAAGTADYPHESLADGRRIALGAVTLEAMATPGHTPESTCYVVRDGARDAKTPHAVFTGDTLFIGDVGRPDLLASVGVSAEDLASALHDSLTSKLLRLPDATLVYPAHGAGSACGRNLSHERVSTIGDQRRLNPALQPMSKREFIALVTSDQPDAPAYFSHDAALNRESRETLDAALRRELRPLSLAEVLRLRNEGAEVVDTRSPAAFAAGHLSGSLSIGLGGKYAHWAGTFLDPRSSVVLVADPGSESEAVTRLGRIGYDRVVGFLEGGAGAFLRQGRPDLVERTPRVAPADLAEELASPARPLVVDVRTPGERAAGHVPGSLALPLARLLDRLDEIPKHGRVVLHCQSGYRSSLAMSLLQRAGYRNACDVEGGWDAISRAEPSCAAEGACEGATG